MSENTVVNFIRSVRRLNREWQKLTHDQRREAVQLIAGEISETAVLIAIRQIRTGQPVLKF